LKYIVDDIINSSKYHKAASIRMYIANPRVDMDEVQMVDFLNNFCPKASISGITCANLSEPEYEIQNNPVLLNVTYFYENTVETFDFDINGSTGFIAGRKMREILADMNDVQCIELNYSCSSVSINSFIKEFSHLEIPIIGVRAGRSVRLLNDLNAYGKYVYNNGIIATVYRGNHLSLCLDYNLGWQEIGVEMMVTKTEGDNIIAEIDGHPATEIFNKYLKINPNKYFIQNVCEFPLIFHRDNCMLARVPAGYDENGSVFFNADIAKGETFRLSFGNTEKLIAAAARSSKIILEFEPESMVIIECGNRYRFLRDKYEREINNFLNICPNPSLAIGYSEIFITPEGHGGAMNSALVTMALKEEENPKVIINTHKDDEPIVQAFEDDSEIPFIDRVLTFLETESLELDKKNRELGNIATRDQLTKIYNRWELESQLNEHLKRVKAGKTAALLFLDIDNFKQVNDNFGHDTGDMILRSVVNIVKDELKPNHIFGRWGGEEFIYIIPDVTAEVATAFAEKIRKRIDEICFLEVKHLTISIGVTMATPEDDIDSFVKRADDALYAAKDGGRNKVVYCQTHCELAHLNAK
nr:diguanylate cyclase [Pseudobutyrivibrio sp.]